MSQNILIKKTYLRRLRGGRLWCIDTFKCFVWQEVGNVQGISKKENEENLFNVLVILGGF